MRSPLRLLTELAALIGLWIPVAPAATTLMPLDGEWRFFRGSSHPSPGNPVGWTGSTFDDAGWERGSATFVYGEPGFSGTDLTGMGGAYSTLFLRRTFSVANPANLSQVELHAICDDGFVAYLNGVRVAAANAPDGNPGHTSLSSANAPEPVAFTPYTIPDAAARLVPLAAEVCC